MLTLITKQKKIRIELEDAEGGKYNLSLEGSMSRDKMVKACELMELLELRGQTINNNINNNNNNTAPQARTKYKFSKIRTWPLWVPRRGGLIEDKFPYASLGSTAIREMCEDGYDEPVQLSIISTCLSIYYERGNLVRSKRGGLGIRNN